MKSWTYNNTKMCDAFPPYQPIHSKGKQGCKHETVLFSFCRLLTYIWNTAFGLHTYDLERCNEIGSKMINWFVAKIAKKMQNRPNKPWIVDPKNIYIEVEKCQTDSQLKKFWLKVIIKLFNKSYDSKFETIMNLKIRVNATQDVIRKGKMKMKESLRNRMINPVKKRKRQPKLPDKAKGMLPSSPSVNRPVLVFEWETVKSRFMQIMFCIVYSACNLEQDSAGRIYNWVSKSCQDIIYALDNVNDEVQRKLHSLKLTETDRGRRAKAEQCIMKDTCMLFSLRVLKEAAKELAVRLNQESCELLAELLGFHIKQGASSKEITNEKNMLFEDVQLFLERPGLPSISETPNSAMETEVGIDTAKKERDGQDWAKDLLSPSAGEKEGDLSMEESDAEFSTGDTKTTLSPGFMEQDLIF